MTRPLWPAWRRPIAAAVAGALLLTAGCSRGEPEQEALGQRVKGTSVSSEAPVLNSGDSWDNLGATNTDEGVRTYSIDREFDEQMIVASVSAAIPNGSEDGLEVDLRTPTGDDCGSQSAESVSYSRALLLTGAVASGKGSTREACVKSKRLVMTVKRTGKNATGWIDLRLRLVRLAGTNAPDTYPDPPEANEREALAFGPTTSKTGGTWLSDAVDVTDQTINSEVGNGSFMTYKMVAKWGQGVQFHVNFPDVPPSIMPDVERAKVKGFVKVLDPAGVALKNESVSLSYAGSVPITLAPAGYKKLWETWALQGTYTIVVGAYSESAADVKIPFSLVAKTYGDTNPALGPDIPVDSVATASRPKPLVWGLLVAGILMTLAGVTQISLHRRHR